MGQSSANQMRQWRGPALFSYGFRPFFLFGSLWAGLAMVGWILALSGTLDLPSRLDPISWHVHAFLFGYLGAAIAGFLLTAVPNWTGRLPVVGGQLIGLFTLWLAGRAALLVSAKIPFVLAAAVDLAFPILLGAFLLREIVTGKNWRNLPVFGLLALFTLADLIFLVEVGRGDFAASGLGVRVGLGAALMMVALIGGRVIPSFTRNWLAKSGRDARPAPPMQRFDKITLLGSVLAMAWWIAAPASPVAAYLLGLMGVLHLLRLGRWKGGLTLHEPLLLVLHVAYLCLPLGALAVSVSILRPDVLASASALHMWTAGMVGGMTLAVMSRATLGHTGRELRAGRGTVAVYAALFAATACRVWAGFVPAPVLYHLAGSFWIAAFLGFAGVYGPMLLFPKRPKLAG